jgi:CheY-like chemotaxis protein
VQRILRNARDIKQLIQSVGQKMTPSQAVPQNLQNDERPLLRGKQILVADADEMVRNAAHALLERYGCIVETAHDGAEAVFMARNTLGHAGYDAIIADIRLPDISGYGYDSTHSIVKARQAGLQAMLSKPFRLDQLLDAVEQVIRSPGPVKQA